MDETTTELGFPRGELRLILLGFPALGLALAWLLRQEGVTAPIIGPRTAEQLDGTLGALEVDLDEATLARIDEIFPGPGPAPEAYAW